MSKVEMVYALLPKVECKGLCHHSCTMIPIGEAEWEYMGAPDVEHTEIKGMRFVPPVEAFNEAQLHNTEIRCPFLTEEKRCSIYERRPLVCRLYGATPRLPCPHGCKSERAISDAETTEIFKILGLVNVVKMTHVKGGK